MQLQKPTEPIAERRGPFVRRGLSYGSLLALGCSHPSVPDSGEDDSQALPDVPADLPNEPTEYEGILHGHGYGYTPTQFWGCESGEVFEMGYSGSCDGVYKRVCGQLDRSFDPPRLLVQETLEARWSTPSDCSFGSRAGLRELCAGRP
jgi:hypothetical protein